MSTEEDRCWAEVNLDHLAHNLSLIREKTSKKTKIMGVVKADAYGHGVAEVAKYLQAQSVDYLAVACVREAVELRKYGVTVPLLVLSHTSLDQAEVLFAYDIIPTVFDLDFAVKLNQAAKGRRLKVHLKIDTGMTRLGFHFSNDGTKADDTVIEDICKTAGLPNLELEGIFSHFASADEEEGEAYTQMQFDRFMALLEKLKARGVTFPIRHICNSAGTLLYPEMHLDMVRCGIILYGVYPSPFVERKLGMEKRLKPLLSLKAKVTQVRTVPKDVCISYGRNYQTQADEKLAVISAGYADGFRRLLGNAFRVLIRGEYAPIRGTVCMDQTVVSVSHIPHISSLDTATLIGEDGGRCITADEMATALGTIHYEVFCLIGKRVPRIYLENDKIVAKTEYLL